MEVDYNYQFFQVSPVYFEKMLKTHCSFIFAGDLAFVCNIGVFIKARCSQGES